MSSKRILAVALRHIFQTKRDLSRVAEIIWFPIIDLMIWGLITSFLASSTIKAPQAVLFFIGGMILWVFVYRMQMSLSISILVDMWERNLLNLFTTPLTMVEHILGLTLVSLLKLTITFIILSFLALIVYSFSLSLLGVFIVPFAVNLMLMGWWMGTIINGLLLRFGFKIESFAWALVYVFNPLSGVFFPLSVMPHWMRTIAQFLPSSYIFEGMRQVLATGVMDTNRLFVSFGLNFVYSVLAVLIYYLLFRSSLRSGMLVKLSD